MSLKSILLFILITLNGHTAYNLKHHGNISYYQKLKKLKEIGLDMICMLNK